MFLASASTTIKCHEFSNGNIVHNYQPGSKVESPIKSISWSPDGNWLVLVPHSGLAEILSIKDQLKLVKTIDEVDEPTCASFPNTSKRTVALGNKNGLVLLYDIKAKSIKKCSQRCSEKVTHLAYTAKDTHLVAGCNSGEVLVFNNVTISPPTVLKVPKSNSLTSLKTNHFKRNLVLGGSNEGILVVWDINVNRQKFVISAHEAPVNSVAFSPTHNDLIVSAGNDRQFSFFDISEKKRIGKTAVENSITALDFSEDGTFCVMASQKGWIYVYDTRNIQTPVRSFQAHQSSIKHISFQKSAEHSKGRCHSTSSLSKDSQVTMPTNEDVKSKRYSDFFGMLAPTADTLNEHKKSVIVSDVEDSLLELLRVDRNSISCSSCGQDDEVFVVDPTKLPTINSRSIGDNDEQSSTSMYEPNKKCPPQTEKYLSTSENPKPYSSTPIGGNQSGPLFGGKSKKEQQLDNNDDPEPATNLKDHIKSVKEELSSMIGDSKKDIEFLINHTAHQLRTMILDVQMAIVKESIQNENSFNNLNDVIRNDPVGRYENRKLVEENEQLRFRIQFLEEQLKLLAAATRKGDDNDNISS